MSIHTPEVNVAHQSIHQPPTAEFDVHAVFGASKSKSRRQPNPFGTPRVTGQFISPFIGLHGGADAFAAEPGLYAAFIPSPVIARRTFMLIGPTSASFAGRCDMAIIYFASGAVIFALFGLYAAGLRRL
eukprot:gene13039-15038_t